MTETIREDFKVLQQWTDREKLVFIFSRMCPDFVEKGDVIIAGGRKFLFSVYNNLIQVDTVDYEIKEEI